MTQRIQKKDGGKGFSKIGSENILECSVFPDTFPEEMPSV
tara:strand:- start:184 stop:303 length:120 start_codon:yes stop_codon:yes gene_type:complete